MGMFPHGGVSPESYLEQMRTLENQGAVEMVERVALAISGSDDPANILAIHRARARLAIEAMREPTEAMVTDGLEKAYGMMDWREAVGVSWRAMVDAALK